MKTKIISIILLLSLISLFLIILIFVSGCQRTGDIRTLSQEDIFTGKKGLEMSFIRDSPPKEVYQDTSFPVIISLSNTGAYDIKDGVLIFSVENDYISLKQENWNIKEGMNLLSENTVKFDLEAKSLSYPKGGSIMFSLQPRALELEQQSAVHTVDLLLLSCFEYETKLSTDVCVDFDVYNQATGTKSCTFKDKTFTKGQGAPVGVSSIKQEIFPQSDGSIKPAFIIEVVNYDDGHPYESQNSELICSSSGSELEKKFNHVEISVSLGGKELECSPGKIMRLREGKDSVRCIVKDSVSNEDVMQSYTTSMLVTLKYGYMKSTSQQITIKKFPE